MTIYITLGWLSAGMIYWLIPVLGFTGMLWMLLGGIFYTAGGYVYTTEQPNPVPQQFGFHEIWHVAVMLGAGSHWILMWFFVMPWKPQP
jgi:hemolysin III